MRSLAYGFSLPFVEKSKSPVPVILLRAATFQKWLTKQPAAIKTQCAESGFAAQPEKTLLVRGTAGAIDSILLGISEPIGLYETSAAVAALRAAISPETLKKTTFKLSGEILRLSEHINAHLGWALACHEFGYYLKKPCPPVPVLEWAAPQSLWPRITVLAESVCLVRDLVNTPSNDMGPDELEAAAQNISKFGNAKISVIRDRDLLKENFPLIYTVGKGSDRRPRLIDIIWGNPKHPKLTLVGKGVCFDTGGLNIKPTASMALMKKDMGGAAHVLGLARMIMALGLPVRLRVLVPAVENSISGDAFRPGDIMPSRKGLTVENTNTDAEGRLILADALALACEESPDLIIDFATLTGSARAGLGPDIPPVFSNKQELSNKINNLSIDIEDPVWPMPLWTKYEKHIASPVADLVNSPGVPGDLIHSALFLYQFIKGPAEPDWMHLDIYAWEHTGRAGRPRGGADTGLRATLALLEARYGSEDAQSTSRQKTKQGPGGKKARRKNARA